MADPIVLWVVPVSDMGGVARHVLDVVRVGGIPGWRLVVLCPEGPFADALRAAGAAVLVDRFGPAAGLKTSVGTLRRVVKKLRPAIVHSHLAYADIVNALATRGLPVKLVSTEHGIAPDDAVYHGAAWKSHLMAAIHHARTRVFDRLIAVCESTRDVMVAKWRPTVPIEVIYNGVDRPVAPRPAATEGARIASIARLSPEKNIEKLLDAFALLRKERPDAHLTVAGTGPLQAELHARADRLGLGDSVEFPGHADAGELIARSDLVVQLSVWENCSYTLLDACAAGAGVLATPVGGNPEILPPSCLVGADDPTQVAARMWSTLRGDTHAPGLDDGWPTVSAMAQKVAQTYGEVCS